MTITDPQGNQWQAEKRGAMTYLLTRPGAVRWATAREVAEWQGPPVGFEGLVLDRPGIWRRAA
jgi:hypothetical protein